MKISRKSWHYWVWYQLSREGEQPTACGYWGTIALSPLLLLLFAVLFVVLFPPMFITGWLTERWRNKTLCPFGKVDFINEDQS